MNFSCGTPVNPSFFSATSHPQDLFNYFQANPTGTVTTSFSGTFSVSGTVSTTPEPATLGLAGFALTLLGISLGLLGSLAFSRFLSALLYGIGVRDPLTFAVVAVALAIVSLAASALPARAAARLDPMTVLRSE